MSGFKLLAIIPLKGCDSKFCKNLEIGTPYKFYQNYKIELEKDFSKTTAVTCLPSNVPNNLYYLKNGINLNISAVVGGNGSGKSTLFELFYYIVYLLAVDKKISNENLIAPYSKELETQLEYTQNDSLHYYDVSNITSKINREEALSEDEKEKLLGNFENLRTLSYKMVEKHQLKNVHVPINKDNVKENVGLILTQLTTKVGKLLRRIDLESEAEKSIKNALNAAIIFEAEAQDVQGQSTIYELSHTNGNFQLISHGSERQIVTGKIEDLDFTKLFYTVSLNYSHHSLNSEIIGNWISRLFHKNDAYITPVVINPMRNKGNFNINDELNLSKERLLGNLLYDIYQSKENYLIEKYRVKTFRFIAKYRTFYPLSFGDTNDFKNDLVGKLLKKAIGMDILHDNYPFFAKAFDYLSKKIEKIKEQYGFVIFKEASEWDNENILLDFLCGDTSHITKKIRQTLNFIKYSTQHKNKNFWKSEDEEKIEFDEGKMIEWINSCVADPEILSPTELSEFALPGFFRIDFDFYQEPQKEQSIPFGKLSSGEQQMILNINSILYHLYNLQSVHPKKSNQKSELQINNRIAYQNINVVLDEIELYYHPEMQRILIKNIVHALEQVKTKNQNGIIGINICFLTHSPFILSDIPTSNILKLVDGKPVQDENQTFGANIHDLLANDFFLRNGFMGEFAKDKIQSLIDFLASKSKSQRRGWNARKAKEFIEIIGEPILKQSLSDLFYIKFPGYVSDKEIDEQIEKLQQMKINR